ncbi:hypothetical protein Tco_1460742, partial [Tanacetum coccineum]
MHTSSSWISKSSKLTLKYFVRSSRSIPDSLTKILLNLPLMKKWFHLSRISGTLASVICYLRSIQIKCTSPGEHLLLSSIGASIGRQELKSCGECSTRRMLTLLLYLDYQKYGALIPEQMINQTIKDSKEYKIYLAFATREGTPKKARKFKKIASPTKKQTLVLEEEPVKKPKRAKQDTPDVPVSKKKALATTDRSKGIDLLSETALLEDAQMKKTTGTNEGTGTILGVPDVPKDQSESENESWGESGDDDDDSNYDDIDNVSDNDGNDDDSDDDGNNDASDDERTESDEDENPNLNQNDDDKE